MFNDIFFYRKTLTKLVVFICCFVIFNRCASNPSRIGDSHYAYYDNVDVLSGNIINPKLESNKQDTLGKFKVDVVGNRPVAIAYTNQAGLFRDTIVYMQDEPAIIHQHDDTDSSAFGATVRPITQVILPNHDEAIVYTLRNYAGNNQIGIYSIDTFHSNSSVKTYVTPDYQQNAFEDVFDFLKKVPRQNLEDLFRKEKISYAYKFYSDTVEVIESLPLAGSDEFGQSAYKVRIFRPKSMFSTITESYLAYPSYLDSNWVVIRGR